MIISSNLKGLRALFLVIFTSCLLFLQPIFAMTCEELLADGVGASADAQMSVEEQLDFIISMETMREDLASEIYEIRGLFEKENHRPALAELDRIIMSLQEVGQHVEHLADQLSPDKTFDSSALQKISNELTQFAVDIKKIRYGNFEYVDSTVNIFRLKHLQDNPSEVVPNTVYKALTHNGDQEVSFLFSRGVVNSLFMSEDKLHKRAVDKSLASIRLGVHSGVKGDGVIMLKHYPGFVEIRQVSGVGHIRIHGYTHNNVFHFVYWIADSDHSVKKLKRVNNAVKKAKERRGH